MTFVTGWKETLEKRRCRKKNDHLTAREQRTGAVLETAFLQPRHSGKDKSDSAPGADQS
jgi:hypothetical protein